MSTPCYYCDLERGIDCKLCIHKVDVAELIQQAHREGWEQSKRECVEIVQNYEHDPDMEGDFVDQLDNAIAAMEYGGKAND